MDLFFERLYSTDRVAEPVFVGVPVAKGELTDVCTVSVKDENGMPVPACARATAYWDDGSVKWLYTDFLADIKARCSASYTLEMSGGAPFNGDISFENGVLSTGKLALGLSEKEGELFTSVKDPFEVNIGAVVLKDKNGNIYSNRVEKWEVESMNGLKATVVGFGENTAADKSYRFEVRVTVYFGKTYFDLAYTVIDTDTEPLEIASLSFEICTKGNKQNIGISNYRTKYESSDGEKIEKLIDADYLMNEANEHNPEVFYGTFFGDVSGDEGGVCATVYQAQQNYPKAIDIENGKMTVWLVPETDEPVTLFMGMQREQSVRIFIHGKMPIDEINAESTLYQMPDRPAVSPEVFERSGVFAKNMFTKHKNMRLEMFLGNKADEHTRSYGMVSWGDSPDMGYTSQGRGGGKLVWTNNEYDFPHACTLQYVRTGTRRFLDYVLVTAKHWMDVDVCHFSPDPLEMGGQWEHSKEHINGRVMICSHEWVEGLLDYYHFTGDIRGLNTALGIAENVLRLLDTPMFKQTGEINARETGWALRTLVAMYVETNDDKWLEKCDWIVGHFRQWKEKYGLWLSPYLDNTEIRVVFMIAIACVSLYRYYTVCKNEDMKAELKAMITESVDDLIENSVLENGLFYYKEIPSLQRNGNNPIILHALAICYELTGDKKYIEAGMPTLEYVTSVMPNPGQSKKKMESSVLYGNGGTKNFAQMMAPVTCFYTAAAELKML